jgi:hypothetical protein
MSENKFKDDKGRWRTQSLFLEQSYGQRDDVLYSMRPDDHPSGYPSFTRLYLELNDPTEYTVATTLLGGWEHWQILQSSKWFSEYLAGLRIELEIKLRADAIHQLHRQMRRGDRVAARFFADAEFKEKKGRGRPTKDEIAHEKKIQAGIAARVEADAERLGLKVID